MGSIYGIRNEINLKWYIGKCEKDIDKRMRDHLTGHGSKLVKQAVDKYGAENFSFHVLLDCILPDFLDSYEIEYIAKYNSVAPNGYNLTRGGEGGIPSAETLEIMRESQRRRREKQGYVPPMLDKNHSKETKIKISENIKNNPLAIQARIKGTQIAAEKNRGTPRPAVVCEKISVKHRKSDYAEMHNFFLSLPADMHLSEKCRVLREQFPDVNHSTFYFRVRKWSGIKGKKEHPNRTEVYDFFFTLPPTTSLPKKRIALHNEFPDITRKNLNRWLNQWSGTQTRIRHPDYSDVNDLFLSFPPDMPLSEKRRLIYEQFPKIKKCTIRKWTSRWQSEFQS